MLKSRDNFACFASLGCIYCLKLGFSLTAWVYCAKCGAKMPVFKYSMLDAIVYGGIFFAISP